MQACRHINENGKFGMNQHAEPTHACTYITTHADKTRLNMSHQLPLAPEVKLDLDGLKSAK